VAPGVPGGVVDRGAEPEPVHHLRALRDPPQVGLDLGLGRERPRPVRVRREGERVELGGDVAGGTGIGVVAPGAADVVAALDHEEVLLAVLGEPDRHAETAEAGADDEHADVVGQARGGRSRGVHAEDHTDGIEQGSIALSNGVQ